MLHSVQYQENSQFSSFCFDDQWVETSAIFVGWWWSISESKNDSSWQIVDVGVFCCQRKPFLPLSWPWSALSAPRQDAVIFQLQFISEDNFGYWRPFLMFDILCCQSSEIVDWVPTLDGYHSCSLETRKLFEMTKKLVGALLWSKFNTFYLKLLINILAGFNIDISRSNSCSPRRPAQPPSAVSPRSSLGPPSPLTHQPLVTSKWPLLQSELIARNSLYSIESCDYFTIDYNSPYC